MVRRYPDRQHPPSNLVQEDVNVVKKFIGRKECYRDHHDIEHGWKCLMFLPLL